ncbi:NAD(P)H-binding protein [Mesorhizobium sp. NBSH29]|uniref:NAD(P)H-binding protein n=1 Tax=Mesorhizobium sp. NBSH29 TaxID=2654249 RepID=UPI00189646D6|nr:NAD(P)H-binding protein [Mesorhizobium sp. NBSH29]QPC85836.1 NAD(P)H-binding protein [Mesorhizobium sp. NBSH29]
MTTGTVLVTAATGKTGRRIVQRLQDKGVPVRSGSRQATPSFDWEDKQTWQPALQGVSAAYIAYYPDLTAPGAPETIGEFISLALSNGVKRLVLLSGRAEPKAQRCEEILKASGADWTILRCSWFDQNFSESFLLDAVLAGEVALPVGEILEPFVDAEDIAEIAVAALTEDHHKNRLYEITGPRLLSFSTAIAEIAAAAGRDISYTQISHAEFKAMLEEGGVPADMVLLLEELFTVVLDGRNQSLADGVQQALGRPPRDFADYARETASTGVWNQ